MHLMPYHFFTLRNILTKQSQAMREEKNGNMPVIWERLTHCEVNMEASDEADTDVSRELEQTVARFFKNL